MGKNKKKGRNKSKGGAPKVVLASETHCLSLKIPLHMLPVENPVPLDPPPPEASHTFFALSENGDLTYTYLVPHEKKLDKLTIREVLTLGTTNEHFVRWLDTNKKAGFSSPGVTILAVSLHGKDIDLSWKCEDIGLVKNTELIVERVATTGGAGGGEVNALDKAEELEGSYESILRETRAMKKEVGMKKEAEEEVVKDVKEEEDKVTKVKEEEEEEEVGGGREELTQNGDPTKVLPPFKHVAAIRERASPVNTPITPSRGTVDRVVKESSLSDLNLARRIQLWSLLDEMADPEAGKVTGKNGAKDPNAHKKHFRATERTATAESFSPSSNSLFMSRLKDLLGRDEELYGKGYGDYLRSHIKRIQDDIKEGRRSVLNVSDSSNYSLASIVTFDVLVKVLSVWEKDEKTRKMNAFEVSPPRKVGSSFFTDKDTGGEEDIPTARVRLSFQGYSQNVEMCAMTSPSDLVGQFISLLPVDLTSTKAAKKIIKKTLEDQLLEPKVALLQAEIKKLTERVQERADKHVVVDEIYRYYKETLSEEEEGGAGGGAEGGTRQEFSPQMMRVADQLLKAKKLLRKMQKRRMTISGNSPLLANKANGGNGRRASSAFVEMMQNNPNVSMDELFSYVDGDGDGSIDEVEWIQFTRKRMEMQKQSIEERNRLLSTQKLLQEKLRNASPEAKERERKGREFAEKKEAMEMELESLMESHVFLKERLEDAVKASKEGTGGKGMLEIERFAKTVAAKGVESFDRILGSAILDDSDDEDEFVTPSALRLALSNLGIDHSSFNLRDVCYFFGKSNRGNVTRQMIVDGVVNYAGGRQ